MVLAEIEAKYTQLKSATDKLLGTVEAQQQARDTLAAQLATLRTEVEVLTYTSAALDQLLKLVSVESLETVESLVSYGLRVVFPDQPLAFKIEVSTKRGLQWMEPKLLQGEVEAPILDAFGGGPATVVAFLLRLLVVRRLGLAPVLLLDEPFAMVSPEYVENVGKLLRELADSLGFTFVMVTQDRAYIEFAHHAYEAVETSGGTIFKQVTT